MGVEKAEKEKRNESLRDFILDKAFVLVETSLKDRGFIVERGFNKLISPFIEMLEKRGWQVLGEHKAPDFVALVKGFYDNGGSRREEGVCQRKVDIFQQRNYK